MTGPAAVEREFYWPFSWRKHAGHIGLCVLVIGIGMGLGEVAREVVLATESFFPACLLGLPAVGIVLVGFVVLFHLAEVAHCQTGPYRLVMVRVQPDQVWITHAVEAFPKTDVIAYPGIVWLSREFTPYGGRCLRIVHGPARNTAYVADLPNPDIEFLYDLLAARCPGALAPHPPVGYCPPQYPERAPLQVKAAADPRPGPNMLIPTGPTTGWQSRVVVFSSSAGLVHGWAVCVAAAIIASLLGSLGACGVFSGCFVLFCGLGFLILVRAVVRPDKK